MAIVLMESVIAILDIQDLIVLKQYAVHQHTLTHHQTLALQHVLQVHTKMFTLGAVYLVWLLACNA